MQIGAHKVLVLGVGNMGRSYALAYHNLDGFEIGGLCSRRYMGAMICRRVERLSQIYQFQQGAG